MEHMLDKDVERVLFSEEELHRRVAEIAAEIDRDYAGREPLLESSPDSCVKCYTMFLPFLLIKIDVFS